MPEVSIVLTPVHWLFLTGVIAIFSYHDPAKRYPHCLHSLLFLIGTAGRHSLAGGVQAIFTPVIYAISQFMEVIATIALVTAFPNACGT